MGRLRKWKNTLPNQPYRQTFTKHQNTAVTFIPEIKESFIFLLSPTCSKQQTCSNYRSSVKGPVQQTFFKVMINPAL